MASVNSPIRKLVKPLLFKVFGAKGYFWFQFYGKLRDIRGRLVEEPEMALLPRLLAPDDAVIDVGANYAYYTVRLAEICPRGQVFAFEPIPATFDVCRQIVKHLRLKNVELFKKGVGAKDAMAVFEVPLQDLGVHSAGQAHLKGRDNDREGREQYHPFSRHQSYECEVVAIDSFLFPRLDRLAFVKIDIEGAELYALQGMRRTLEKFRPAVLIEIVPFFLKGFGIDERQLSEEIASLGYRVFAYEPTSGRLVAAREPYQDRNYILLHETALDKHRALIASEAAS